MRLIFEAVLKHKSQYYAVLPYNLNWRTRDWYKLAPVLKRTPIHVLDVGARDKMPDEISPLSSFIDYVGFDADEKEASRLQAIGNSKCERFRIINAFVGAHDGPMEFYLYRDRGQSSALEPDSACSPFYSDLTIDRTVAVNGVTLDTLVRNGTLTEVDLIKLDTQGTEYDIIQNGKSAFQRALLVDVEMEFLSLYKGQRLFFDVCRVLYEYGFCLVYLNRVFLTRHRYHGPSRGQMVFGDGLFALREDLASALPKEKKIKYIVLLIQYGLMDFAHSLYINDHELRKEIPELAEFFVSWGRGYGSLLKRYVLMWFDKFLFLALHWRGTNQLTMDSDRSWPVR